MKNHHNQKYVENVIDESVNAIKDSKGIIDEILIAKEKIIESIINNNK